ncbi:MAG: hypothetical protein JOZ07_00645 [Solirubrobacterales bacterium]|nr:hypothetical protein [Solirubrobacterales bacterium]
MSEKLQGTAPLALAIGILGFLYVEFTANFTFHWVTSGTLLTPAGKPNGLDLPSHFHLGIPIGFIAWGLFFQLGANGAAPRRSRSTRRSVASARGSRSGLPTRSRRSRSSGGSHSASGSRRSFSSCSAGRWCS